ncbi:RNA-binding protein 1-like [Pistacia vera]|uniref:RNA-binding protein 1-like n=1 Tax=Pistacia vera TaxID=55513 RepID=UPI0012631995|nr:RNA-binding protein 1-like [Pistacia vera]
MARASRETLPLPPDASNTLYVEVLPPTPQRRSSSYFRPFVDIRVRLGAKNPNSPACAATAMSALQVIKMDEDDSDSRYLRLQFSRFPGPRSSSGTRGGGE